jgi:hypothetical protein
MSFFPAGFNGRPKGIIAFINRILERTYTDHSIDRQETAIAAPPEYYM